MSRTDGTRIVSAVARDVLAWAGLFLAGCGSPADGDFQAGDARTQPVTGKGETPPVQAALPQPDAAAAAVPVPAGFSALADTPPTEETIQVLAAVRRERGSVLAGASFAKDDPAADEPAEFRQALGAATAPGADTPAAALPAGPPDPPRGGAPPYGDFQLLPRVVVPGDLRAFGGIVGEDDPLPENPAAPTAADQSRGRVAAPLRAAAVALEHLAADAEAAGQPARADRLRALSQEVRRESRRQARAGANEKTGNPAAFSRPAN